MPAIVHENKRNVVDIRDVNVGANERLKIKVDDLDILNQKCPADQSWAITIHIEIDITDA